MRWIGGTLFGLLLCSGAFGDNLASELREGAKVPTTLITENASSISDGFFNECLKNLEPPSKLAEPQRSRIVEGCLLAASLKGRPDIAQKLFAADPQTEMKWRTRWTQANELMSSCRFEEAKSSLLEVRRGLYKPDLCCYRLAEIEALYGDALAAARYMSEAREFEEQLNPRPVNTIHPFENSQDLLERK